ncbi:MAG: CxxC-x17-CxxC domain-containing protein [bacterium]
MEEGFKATCSDCGTETTLPFQPTGDRPVYCRDCFAKRRPARMGGNRSFGDRPRQEFKAVCSDCGSETTVPFRPTEGKPVYCRDCFMKRKNG